jgi:hypothetical protein
MSDKNIKLGSKVREITTGFEGIATAKIEYLNGCIQYCVSPKVDKEGKRGESYYIDWQSLEYVNEGINVKGKGTGGPSANAPTSYRG